MLPSKYDTIRYSPFLVIPPPPFFFYLSFFFFLVIFIIANSYIFFIGSDETGSDRVFRNSNRNDFGKFGIRTRVSIEFLSLIHVYLRYIYIFFLLCCQFLRWMDIYIYISKYRIFRLHFFFPCTDRL